MKYLILGSMFAVLSLAGVGCSSSSNSTLSCTFTEVGINECAEYDNLPSADDNAITTECTSVLMGTTGSGCSTSNLVGSCAMTVSMASAGSLTYKTFMYTTGTTSDAATLQSSCTLGGGTWKAGG